MPGNVPWRAAWPCIGRRSGLHWVLDYHECEDSESLIRVLNEIAQSGFLLEKVIPRPDECFVVLFRRNDFG